MNKTKIEWCTHTINPVMGCKNICEYCYARKITNRFKWIPDFSEPQFFPERLKLLNLKKPKIIFMNSMSDVSDWEQDWYNSTLEAMKQNPQHRYLFLTKNPRIFCEKKYATSLFENMWIGTSITKESEVYKSYDLPEQMNKFVSLEPLHENLNFLKKQNQLGEFIKWAIIGSETGNRKGKIVTEKEWVDDIVTACAKQGIPVFMKDSLINVVGEKRMKREFPKELKFE